MSREAVIAEILQSGSLPTLSNVASKLITITGKEDTQITEITQLIAQDVSLSAKVLRVVNSAFYNFPNEVSTIQQAVAILGTKAVRSLVLSFSFLSMEKKRRDSGFDYERFWEQSLATAVSAKLIVARIQGSTDPEEVFTVSLLQNIGVLILAQAFPEMYDAVLHQARQENGELWALEQERLGVSHPEIGQAAAKHWNFPESLSEPILCHRDPDLFRGNNQELRQVIQVCYLAGLVSNILYSSQPIVYAERFRKQAKSLLGLPGKEVDRILESVNREVAQAAEYFGLKIGGTDSIPEILQKANIELGLLNLSYEQINRELVNAKLELEKLNAELQEKNLYLESIANLDGLTGVFNHRYLQENFDRELNRAERSDRHLSFLLADLDRFKALNDQYGHQAGDYVLKEVCRVWKGALRDYDVLARYGGEEFAVLLPETTEDEAMIVAEKLRRALDDHEFSRKGERYGVSASFGVASFTPDGERASKNELIEKADLALYEAKRKGRNRVERFQPKQGKWYQKLRLSV